MFSIKVICFSVKSQLQKLEFNNAIILVQSPLSNTILYLDSILLFRLPFVILYAFIKDNGEYIDPITLLLVSNVPQISLSVVLYNIGDNVHIISLYLLHCFNLSGGTLLLGHNQLTACDLSILFSFSIEGK